MGGVEPQKVLVADDDAINRQVLAELDAALRATRPEARLTALLDALRGAIHDVEYQAARAHLAALAHGLDPALTENQA